MSLDRLPRISVNFNELVEPGLVLLSKTDLVECDGESRVVLQQGMSVLAFEYNVYDDGSTEYLYVHGYADKNDPEKNGEWTRAAQWCCRFSGEVQWSEVKV